MKDQNVYRIIDLSVFEAITQKLHQVISSRSTSYDEIQIYQQHRDMERFIDQICENININVKFHVQWD